MNLSTMRTEVRGELQEASAAEFSTAEIDAYLNEAVLVCQQLTEYLQKTSNLVCVVGQREYTLPTDILRLIRVTFDHQFLPETTQYELDRDAGNWRAANNADPIRHFEPQWDTLSLYPEPVTAGTAVSFDAETGVVIRIEDPSGTPDPDITFDAETGIIIAVEDSAGGQVHFLHDTYADPFELISDPELGTVIDYDTDEENVGLFYAALPDTMVETTDSPQLPEHVHPACVSYTVYRCLDREGPFQDKKTALLYFQDMADWMNSVLELQGNRWPEKAMALEPVTRGSMFERRLNEVGLGSPLMENLRAHYE